MSASSEPRHGPVPGLPRPLSVRSWPARDAGWRALLPAAALGALAVLLGLAAQSWLAAAAAAGIVALSAWRYWLPVDFDLDANGITQRVGRRRWRIPWTAIGGYAIRSEGVALWPAGAGSLASLARGIVIPWNGQREALLEAIADRLGPPA